MFLKSGLDISVSVAADGGVFWQDGDVGKVVETAEEVHFREFGNTGNKDKFKVSVIIFNHTVKCL